MYMFIFKYTLMFILKRGKERVRERKKKRKKQENLNVQQHGDHPYISARHTIERGKHGKMAKTTMLNRRVEGGAKGGRAGGGKHADLAHVG